MVRFSVLLMLVWVWFPGKCLATFFCLFKGEGGLFQSIPVFVLGFVVVFVGLFWGCLW